MSRTIFLRSSSILVWIVLFALPAAADVKTFGWWENSGDATSLGGVTVRLTGSNLERFGTAVRDLTGPMNADVIFTFDPPVESFEARFSWVADFESIDGFNHAPSAVLGDLRGAGTPVVSVRGVQPGDFNVGALQWRGTALHSVRFTMANADGAVAIESIAIPAGRQVERGRIGFSNVARSDEVELTVTLEDDGSVPEFTSIAIERRPFACGGRGVVVACIPRTPGTRSDHRFIDRDVQPGHAYTYELVPFIAPTGVPAELCLFGGEPSAEFNRAFGDEWGWLGFQTHALVGQGAVPLARGRLKATGADRRVTVLDACGCTNDAAVHPWVVPEEALPYVDTPTHLEIYGVVYFDNWQNGFGVNVTEVVPTECITSVVRSSWSNLKRLYR